MGTVAGRIAEQGLKLRNEMAAEAFSLESFASSGLERSPRFISSEVTTHRIGDSLPAVVRLVAGAPQR